MQLRKRRRDALQEEEQKEENATAHEAISVADWTAQSFGKGRKSPRQEMHGTSVRCRVCTGPHPNAYYCCLRCSNEEGKPFGICGSKTGQSCIEKHQRDALKSL